MTAESLAPEDAMRLSGYQNRDTWGKLESSLATHDRETLTLAIEMFKNRLEGEKTLRRVRSSQLS